MDKLKNCYDGINDVGFKLRFVLYCTWVWVMFGLYVTKLMEFIFKCILYIPNALLSPVDSMLSTIKTTDGELIHILSANDINGNDIKNKVKLFISRYYEPVTDINAHDTNGFDMKKLCNMLNSNEIDLIFKRGIGEAILYFIKHDPIKNKTTVKNIIDEFITELFLHHFTFDEEPLSGSETASDYDNFEQFDESINYE